MKFKKSNGSLPDKGVEVLIGRMDGDLIIFQLGWLSLDGEIEWFIYNSSQRIDVKNTIWCKTKLECHEIERLISAQ